MWGRGRGFYAGGKRGGTDEASKLRDLILRQRDQNQPQKWVEMIEEIPSYLYPGLVRGQDRTSWTDGQTDRQTETEMFRCSHSVLSLGPAPQEVQC